jgi:hypothetical protein
MQTHHAFRYAQQWYEFDVAHDVISNVLFVWAMVDSNCEAECNSLFPLSSSAHDIRVFIIPAQHYTLLSLKDDAWKSELFTPRILPARGV